MMHTSGIDDLEREEEQREVRRGNGAHAERPALRAVTVHQLLSLEIPPREYLLEPFLTEADLIVIDSISTLAGAGKENEAESWLPMQEWALALRRAGKSVLLLHHDGKGGQQRGTSRREDILDVVIHLRRPADYEPQQGARFEVH